MYVDNYVLLMEIAAGAPLKGATRKAAITVFNKKHIPNFRRKITMAVKIRLRRMGSKKAPFYRIVVADSRYPRNGRFIEEIGYYDPMKEPAVLNVDNEKAAQWIKNGAQPTDTVRDLLKRSGTIA
jgi:ribosomal protein S16